MKRFTFLFLFMVIASVTFSQNNLGALKMNSPVLMKIISGNITTLAEGHEWTEGPLWLPGENKLIYSDIPKNSIFEWSEEGGKKGYLKPAGYTGFVEREGEPGSNVRARS